MNAFVYVLALLFFTITNGQVTSWTGLGANNTVSNTENWSHGIPTANSIVYINDTGCLGCTVIFDIDIIVAELHLDAVASSGPIIEVIGTNLTVTKVFNFGNPTTALEIYVKLSAGGIFELGTSCAANIYPTYSNTPIYQTDNGNNWIINKGTVTVHSTTSATSYYPIYIGYGSSSSYQLNVASWGSWVVTDPKGVLIFNYINTFNIYSGSFHGTWEQGSTTEVTIQFYNTEVVLQEGAGGDATGAGAVSFQYVHFQSSYSIGSSNYGSYPASTVIFNTTGVTIADSIFDGVNIVFLNDGWLMDCNITNWAVVNSSSTISGPVHAYFTGQNNNLNEAAFAGIGTPDFIVEVDYDAQVTMKSTFSLFGSVTLINNGTWVFDSNAELYWDAQATWVNLGLIDVITSHNDFIQGSTFPGLSSPTTVGTLVNMGTIQFRSNGGWNFYDHTGVVRQCKHGILKFEFDNTGTSSGSVQLPEVYLDGYIGVVYGSTNTFPQNLFTWNTPATAVFPGSIDYIATGPGVTGSASQLLCYSKVTNTAKVYDITSHVTCPTGETQILGSETNGNACSSLPDSIKNLEDSASCPASNGCGLATGSPSGGNPPPPGGSVANVNVASLAFLVSLVCLLLKF